MEDTPVGISFVNGIDTKSDPKQIQIGKFLSLQNSVFDETGLMKKRFGYPLLSKLPAPSSYLTTFAGNLTAVGSTLQAYSRGTKSWVNKGNFQPISVSVQPVARSAYNQVQADSVTSSNGFICTAYTETSGATSYYRYVIQDSESGQNIIAPTDIPAGAGTISGSPRVFLLGGYFIIVFTNTITATKILQYIAISITQPSTVTANASIASGYGDSASLSWDGAVYNNRLYLAYNTTLGGQQVVFTYLDAALQQPVPTSFIGSIASIMGVYVDQTVSTDPVVYAAFYNLGTTVGYVIAVDADLNKVMTPTQIISSGTVNNITLTAQSGIATVAYEVANAYSYDSNAASNYIKKVAVTKPVTVTTGAVGSTTILVRSVGLASKAFLLNSNMYMLTAFDDKTSTLAALQPTYFLVNLSGQVLAKLAYQNGGGYRTTGLPYAQIISTGVSIPYLFKDLIQSVNKTQGLPSASGIYSQTGVNLAFLDFSTSTFSTSEIGNNLNLSGGFLWAYDGNTLNEQNFHVYPDMDLDLDGSGTSKALTVSHSGGSMTTQNYFYKVIYQWTDAQGNTFMSAPSVPVPAASASFSGSSNSVTVNVPTCRLTYKSLVKILIYRWSTAQQNYFQVTSITTPTISDPTVDSVSFVDTQADTAIVGNSLIYTTGGVIENTGAVACTSMTIFDSRAWLISAEQQNTLWFSKQVLNGTPVEFSDLFTQFVAPNAGTSASVGTAKCLFPMDDKLIVFLHSKSSGQAMYYINGNGPDNTGVGSQYSQPTFITSTVSCVNQNSLALSPSGIMFQAADGKGIWILTRDLQTQYIGAPVEKYNSQTVTSATNIPGTTYIVFTLSGGISLMYDYYFNEWGTWVGASAISSTIYQNRHTLMNSQGYILQQTPGTYLDNGNPVLMQFQTGWVSLAGLQGFQRAKHFYFLGDYISPHKLSVGISYDYALNPQQYRIITPINQAPLFGSTSPFGGDTPFGGTLESEQWRTDFQRQKCQAFQITVQESYNPAIGLPAGAGFTLSGLNLIAKIKRGSRPIRALQTSG